MSNRIRVLFIGASEFSNQGHLNLQDGRTLGASNQCSLRVIISDIGLVGAEKSVRVGVGKESGDKFSVSK